MNKRLYEFWAVYDLARNTNDVAQAAELALFETLRGKVVNVRVTNQSKWAWEISAEHVVAGHVRVVNTTCLAACEAFVEKYA